MVGTNRTRHRRRRQPRHLESTWGNDRKERPRKPSLFARLTAWLNRRKFYTFHKDEMITNKQFSFASNQSKLEDEWNNESESDDMEEEEEEEEEGKQGFSSGVVERKFSLDANEGKDREALLGRDSSGTALFSSTVQSRSIGHTTRTTDGSLTGSLESMDSLVESQWDAEDDSSNVTPLVTNIPQPAMDAFFAEHVRFLQVQTQPRKVAEVYHDKAESKLVE